MIGAKQQIPALACRQTSLSLQDLGCLNRGDTDLGDRQCFHPAQSGGIGGRSDELRNNDRVEEDHSSPRNFRGSPSASGAGSSTFSPSDELLKIRTIISPALSSSATVCFRMRRKSSCIDIPARPAPARYCATVASLILWRLILAMLSFRGKVSIAVRSRKKLAQETSP